MPETFTGTGMQQQCRRERQGKRACPYCTSAGNKSFAAGSGTSYSWDEQLAMGIAVLAPIMHPMGYVISSNLIVCHIVKDYLDQTIPDGAYYLGYIMAKKFLYEEGWEAGKLETFQGKQYGGCVQ